MALRPRLSPGWLLSLVLSKRIYHSVGRASTRGVRPTAAPRGPLEQDPVATDLTGGAAVDGDGEARAPPTASGVYVGAPEFSTQEVQ